MHRIFKETVTVTAEMADEFGRLRPSAALHLTQNAAAHHCEQLALDESFMAEKGYFWAIIRNCFTAEKMPLVGQSVTLETWPMPTTRTCFPRACVAYDENGELLFAVHSLWIMMDRQSRAMILPGKSGIDVPGIDRENTPPAPKSLSPLPMDATVSRTVTSADLDRNGHMNNARYLDWAEEALGAAYRQDKLLRRATLCYLNEAKEGQMLQNCMTFNENGAVLFDLRRDKETGSFDRIFSAALEYDAVVM